MKKSILIIMAALTIFSGKVFAEDFEDELELEHEVNHEEKNEREKLYIPVVVSFASNEFLFATRKSIVANGAFGLLGSTLYQVNGIQASGLMNITKEIRGIQSAGLFNVNSDRLFGSQSAGLFNINGSTLGGLQAAGIFNVTGGSVNGLQAAGIFNVAGGGIRGLQASGILNIAGNKSSGLQLSGVMNICGGDMKGLQIGLVNICSGDCGFQLGLLNISKNGIFDFGVSATSNGELRYAVSSGTRHLYTTLGYSTNNIIFTEFNLNSLFFDNVTTFAGLGTRLQLGFLNVDLEALYNTVYFRGKSLLPNSAGYLSARLSGGITLFKHINLFAGYSVGFEHSDFGDSELAFEHSRSNIQTYAGNGIILHHEIDLGVKIRIK